MSDKDVAAATPARESAPDPSNWGKLRRGECRALIRRWRHAYPEAPIKRGRHTPRIGLALSGGGIRSATFCIGLMRGMAQNRILRRFDYLSTVSGGGYAGSVFGRLVATLGIDKAEATLAAGDSIILTWLRRYGRYLTPAGARDFGMLIATYLRSAVAVHFEIGLLAMLVGLLVATPHAILPGIVALDENAWHGWRTFWWPLALAVWLACGPALMIAYWNVRAKTNRPSDSSVNSAFAWLPLRVLLLVSLGLLVWAIMASASYLSLSIHPLPPLAPLLAISTLGTFAVLSWLWIKAIAQQSSAIEEFVAKRRSGLTRALRFVNKLVLALACLGLLDFACWSLIEWHRFRIASGEPDNWLIGGIGAGAVLAILLRTFAEPLQKLANAPDNTASRWIPRLINIAGLGVGVLVVGAWALLVQWLVFDESSWSLLDNLTSVQRIGVIFVALAIWFASTSHNRDTVNASSLHSFYRARLIRAYLSVGNPERFKTSMMTARSGAGRSTQSAGKVIDNLDKSVTDYLPDDDVPLRQYQPEAKGGPIHLVCACINQTIDDRSKLFNADRKGAAIVASMRAVEVGLDEPDLASATTELGTLGHWVATSGAAAAPGAGSNTTSGWALLLFMVGARLGYWRDSLTLRSPGSVAAKGSLRDGKSGLLLAEALAWFAGKSRRWWFLSDGGHFDNTGVYALLRRELDCIVLADCGADPKFEFSDLENLIRKARIDFDADIEFYTRREVAGLFPSSDGQLQVLALEDMKDNTSARGVLLARICYHSSDPSRRKIGSLLVVKPNLHEALNRDLLAYAARNASFPQQSTGDQFFDEAQWESYHRLGHDFGRAMTSTWLRHVPGWRVAVECPVPLLPLRTVSVLDTAAKVETVPFWRRGMAATALGTGIGLGAFGTVLLSGWQVIKTIQEEQRELVSQAAQTNKEALVLAEAIEPSVASAIDGLETKRDCLHAAADSQPDSAAACVSGAATDLNRINGGKLRQLYAIWRGGQVVKHGAVHSMILDVQHACGSRNGVCASDTGMAPNLCATTCEQPRIPSSYWLPPALASDWDRNPVVAWTSGIARSLLGDRYLARDPLASSTAPAPTPDPTPMPTEPVSGIDVIGADSTDLPPMLDAPASAMPPAPAPETAPTAADIDSISQAEYERGAAQQQARISPQSDVRNGSQTRRSLRPSMRSKTIQSATAPEDSDAPALDAAGATAAAAEPEVAAEPVLISVTLNNFPSCKLDGKPVTIYAQIFDESQRETLKALGQKWLGPHARNDNASVAGIENVVATALQRGSTPPREYRSPTMIVHDQRDKDCASAIAAGLQADFDSVYGNTDAGYISIRDLPKSLAASTPRHVIELWMPTPTHTAAQ